MAIDVKTRELHFPVLVSALNSTETAFTSITIPIPETSITFKSVVFELYTNDMTNVALSYSRRQLSIQLAANGFSVQNDTTTLSSTGENITIFGTYDFTSYFNTYWSGTSMTCDANVIITQGTTLEQRDLTLKIQMTYEYDDTSDRHAKTVWIPINGATSFIPSSKSSAIALPDFSNLLPETNITINQSTLIFESLDTVAQLNTSHSGSLNVEIDSSGSYQTIRSGSQSSNRFFRYTVPDTNVIPNIGPRNLYLWSNSTVGFRTLTTVMGIDYTFDATSSRVLNSVKLPMEFIDLISSAGASNSRPVFATRVLWIAEPGTITLQSSSYMMNFPSNNAGETINSRLGVNDETTNQISFITGGSTTISGTQQVMHVFTNSDTVSLNRGKNLLTTRLYRQNTSIGDVSGIWFINYHSDRNPAGVSRHNKSVFYNNYTTFNSSLTSTFNFTASAPIPNISYFINSVGQLIDFNTTSGTTFTSYISTNRDVTNFSDSTVVTYNSVTTQDAELGIYKISSQLRDYTKRFTGDVDSLRFSITASRFYTASFSNGVELDYVTLVTYHSNIFPVSGSILNATGNVTLDLYRSGDNSKLKTQTVDGTVTSSYYFDWYDDTVPVYVIARESSTKNAVTPELIAGTGSSFNVNLLNTLTETYF